MIQRRAEGKEEKMRGREVFWISGVRFSHEVSDGGGDEQNSEGGKGDNWITSTYQTTRLR